MSNHFSAAGLKHPGDDARLDLTDLFVFTAPGNPDRTVLVMNSNPFTKGDGFHPEAVYRFNIDTDGDALADVAFSFTFSPYDNGLQTATAYYATGTDAQTREPRGEVLIQATPVGFDATAAVSCIGTWTTDFRADLPQIDVPVLVLHGDADQVLPLDKTSKRLPGLIKDVQLTVVEGGPHAIPWTHAAQVNTALLDFLRR